MAYKPIASSPEISERMRQAKTRGTKPELMIRRLLHAAGYRYRVQFRASGLARRTVDLAFPCQRVAVFIDGCFWHGCTLHRSIPKSNNRWWSQKLTENHNRDVDTDERLKRLGWRVLRFWEHDDPANAVSMIRSVLKRRPGAKTDSAASPARKAI